MVKMSDRSVKVSKQALLAVQKCLVVQWDRLNHSVTAQVRAH
jgi:predicted DNA-binding WGR domain protein